MELAVAKTPVPPCLQRVRCNGGGIDVSAGRCEPRPGGLPGCLGLRYLAPFFDAKGLPIQVLMLLAGVGPEVPL